MGGVHGLSSLFGGRQKVVPAHRLSDLHGWEPWRSTQVTYSPGTRPLSIARQAPFRAPFHAGDPLRPEFRRPTFPPYPAAWQMYVVSFSIFLRCIFPVTIYCTDLEIQHCLLWIRLSDRRIEYSNRGQAHLGRGHPVDAGGHSTNRHPIAPTPFQVLFSHQVIHDGFC